MPTEIRVCAYQVAAHGEICFDGRLLIGAAIGAERGPGAWAMRKRQVGA
jgi:hypothetical protein